MHATHQSRALGLAGDSGARVWRGLPILCVALLTLGSTLFAQAAGSIRWVHAIDDDERAASARWAAAVGPPAIRQGGDTAPSGGTTLVISWNTHVGGGDVERIVDDARAGRLTGVRPDAVVLLLQEVYRSGDPVPPHVPDGAAAAAPEAPRRPDGSREDVVETARRLGAWLFYVPSMRNGRAQEDRGNAILATVPLSDLEAVELPLEHQRRVAVAATATLPGRGRTRLVCTHFTNLVAHHLWLFAEAGRVRQAEALRGALPAGPLVVGGDLNSWFGYRDAAYRELAAALGDEPAVDRRPTFGPMRLDHLFVRPAGERPAVKRLDDRYGSDHYPLIAELR